MKKELITYLPEMFHDVREFKEIFAADTEAIEGILTAGDEQLNNLFLYGGNMTSEGLDRWGESLNIDLSGLTDDEKLFKIKSVLIEQRPYNLAKVKAMLTELCGEGNATFLVDYENLSVSVKLGLSSSANIETVTELLERVLPMNLSLTVTQMNTYGVLKLAGITYGELEGYSYDEVKQEDL